KVKRTFRKRMSDAYDRTRARVLGTKSGQRAKAAYQYVRPLVMGVRKSIRKMRGEPLPHDTNIQLVNAAKTLCRKNIPVLMLMAGTREEHAEKFDYLKHICGYNSPSMTVDYLPGVTHSFT